MQVILTRRYRFVVGKNYKTRFGEVCQTELDGALCVSRHVYMVIKRTTIHARFAVTMETTRLVKCKNGILFFTTPLTVACFTIGWFVCFFLITKHATHHDGDARLDYSEFETSSNKQSCRANQ